MRKRYLFTISVALFLIIVSTAFADIPRLITYQGRLTDDVGVPVPDGTYDVNFTIYDDSLSGSMLWGESHAVTTTDGLFNVQLGLHTSLDETIFIDYADVFISLQLSGHPEMAPRTRLTSSAFCYEALHAEGADYALAAVVGGGWRDDGTVVRLDTPTDSVGIGTSTPTAKLDVVGDAIINGRTTFGTNQTNSGSGATITGGNGSIASGDYAVIGGGESNLADSGLTTVGGGQGNIASGLGTTIGGGAANQAFARFSTIAGGGPYDFDDILNTNNQIYDQYSVIGGGAGNRAGTNNGNIEDASYVTVGGGIRNNADGSECTIAGGSVNTASNRFSTVGGGNTNSAIGYASTVCGGDVNSATAHSSTVGGGQWNLATGPGSVVAGGFQCYARGYHSVVGGGGGNGILDSNSAYGVQSAILGGVSNAASDTGTVVGGGGHNYARGVYSVVAGGGSEDYADSNSAQGRNSVIGGGSRNVAGGSHAVVGGGHGNNAGARGTTVSGGYSNSATVAYATVAGGISNDATDQFASIGGGMNNTAGAEYSTVIGGEGNTASGYCSAVLGGQANTASGNYSIAAGMYAQAIHSGTFVWADNHIASFPSTANNQFLIRASGGVGIGTISPGAMLDVADDDRALRLRAGNGQAGYTDHQILLSYGGTVNYSHSIKSRHSSENASMNAIEFYVWDPAVDASIEPGTKHVMTIDGEGASGEVGIGTTDPNYTLDVRGSIGNNTTLYHSDKRWKTNIVTIPDALEKVFALRGVNFKWRQDEYEEMNFPAGEHLGVIAQEVEAVLPQLVHTDDDGYKSVEYANLTALLIEAVKELDHKTREIDELKTQMSKMQKQLEGLQTR